MLNTLDEYYLKLLNVDSLLGDLLIKKTNKIPIFNPMKNIIQSNINMFAELVCVNFSKHGPHA